MDIKKMLPFLEEEELEALAEKIISSPDQQYQGITINHIMPFLDDDYIDHIFYESLKKNLPVTNYLPFVNDDILSKAADDFANGRLDSFPLKQALPFMDEEDIDKIALKCLESDNETFLGVSFKELMPFIDDDVINKIFLERVNSNGNYAELLPYIDDDVLSKVVDDYVSGKGNQNIDMDKIYPFLDDDDIKKLFRYELNKNK